MPRVVPSILAADFGRLRGQAQEVVAAGANMLQVDVMDGHFVPPITMGAAACAALRDVGAHLEAHLMVERPERHVAAFAEAGVGTIIVHAEATPQVHYALSAVREAGCRAGLALNPATAPDVVREVAADVDMVLCMTVDPGWGGQRFIPASLDRLRRLRALLPGGADLEVDGGIDESTAGPCADAGATLLVAGTAVFGADDPGEAFRRLTAVAEAAAPAAKWS